MTTWKLFRGLFAAWFVVWSAVAPAATLLPPGKQTFFDSNGAPLVNGKVQFFIPGTTTPKDTWQDAGQTILNPNPVILDASGQAVIYGSGAYRQVVRDAALNLIWDQLTSDTSSSNASWGGTSTGSPNAQIVAASNFTSQDGQTISYLAGFTNTGPLTINPNGAGAIAVVKDSPTGSAGLTGGEIAAGTVATLTYSTSTGTFHTPVVSAIPAGTVIDFAGPTAPAGFLFAFGQCVSRTTYAVLFSVISTLYGGGCPADQFGLPDLRGRAVAGVDNMGGAAANRLTGTVTGGVAGTLAAVGGEQGHVQTVNELAAHNHGGLTTAETTTISVSYTAPSGTVLLAAGTLSAVAGTTTLGANPNAVHQHTIPSAGNSAAMNVVQPTIVLNKAIKF